jgi:hypothetical protein
MSTTKMNSSHKTLLLEGCREVFGHQSRSDNVELVCNGGQTHVNILVLAAISPSWLRKALLEANCDDFNISIPWVNIDDLVTFLTCLHEDLQGFGDDSEAVQLECAMSNLSTVFDLKALMPTDENDQAELELYIGDFKLERTKSSSRRNFVHDRFHDYSQTDDVAYLSDQDVKCLEDQVITDNFSDQAGRLVCLVCYKIFGKDCQDLFRNHLSSHPKAMIQRIKIRNTKLPPSKLKTKVKLRQVKQVVLKSHAALKPSQLLKAKKTTSSSGGVAKCSQCGYECANNSGLKAHAKIHMEKTFCCTVCQRHFLSDKLLLTHAKSGICLMANRQCRICKKIFSDPTRLKIHLRKHSGEKPWTCTICSKSFNELRSLKEHKLTHEPDRRHECQHCPKKFVQKNHLLYHLATLHGVAPPGGQKHVCKICSRTYAFAFQLKKHEAKHINKLAHHFRRTTDTGAGEK